ncbi:hypothetical protein [Halorubrum cibi]|uniref:hypothetical protein n=1 Tax=Halorubrum cibi TaxID=413815 RepID=UPI0024831876|nr:hypothetical protein [Halorubrum cibi]
MSPPHPAHPATPAKARAALARSELRRNISWDTSRSGITLPTSPHRRDPRTRRSVLASAGGTDPVLIRPVGNVVGSNVFNVLGVLGVAAAIRPLTVGGVAMETLLWLTVLTVFMVAALWSGRRLSRPEGALFLLSEVARWVLGLLRIFG